MVVCSISSSTVLTYLHVSISCNLIFSYILLYYKGVQSPRSPSNNAFIFVFNIMLVQEEKHHLSGLQGLRKAVTSILFLQFLSDLLTKVSINSVL